jgi:hypothetical protein
LFILAAAVWVRSYFEVDYFRFFDDTPGETTWTRRQLMLLSRYGGLMINYSHAVPLEASSLELFRRDHDEVLGLQKWTHFSTTKLSADGKGYPFITPERPHFLGLQIAWGYSNSAMPMIRRWDFTIVVPYWFLVAVSSAFPLRFAISRYVRMRRGRRGACPECGYDLRATPERCPECGTVPASKAEKT